MPSGGRRARSGPAPDPMSQTSVVNGREFVVLPLRHGVRAPQFPLPRAEIFVEYFVDKVRVRELDEVATRDFHDLELDFWKKLWKRPQAVMWKRLGLEMQLAAYTRAFLESTRADASAGLKTAVLRMESELGISISGMLQNGWVIESDADVVSSSPVKEARKRQTQTGNWLEAVRVESA